MSTIVDNLYCGHLELISLTQSWLMRSRRKKISLTENLLQRSRISHGPCPLSSTNPSVLVGLSATLVWDNSAHTSRLYSLNRRAWLSSSLKYNFCGLINIPPFIMKSKSFFDLHYAPPDDLLLTPNRETQVTWMGLQPLPKLLVKEVKNGPR